MKRAIAFVALIACASTSTPASKTPPSHEPLPFIHDDYPKARAEAKRSNKPLFVDAWAPWCHSCVSLRAYVLTDPSLASLAPDFVWLSVDTEKDANAEWLTRYPHAALPTLWVIDPATDRPLLKWAGTPTADELRGLLKVALSDQRDAFQGIARGDDESAERDLRAALASAPKGQPQRARILDALVNLLQRKKQYAECASLGAQAAELPATSSRASVLVAALGCAREGADDPKLAQLALADARGRDDKLLADDRSALYEEVFETLKHRGDPAGARKIGEEWATYLETEASRAKTTDARAALDPNRLSAYLALGAPERAIPMLDRTEKDFPDDYNPPARLGRVYLEIKRLDDAERAVARATARVYGPRAMRVYALKADIAKARGDRAGEIRALEEALARSAQAVLTEGQKSVRDGLVKRRDSLR
jgi:thioredoxin-like negative regulator of GroEL